MNTGHTLSSTFAIHSKPMLKPKIAKELANHPTLFANSNYIFFKNEKKDCSKFEREKLGLQLLTKAQKQAGG